MSVSRRGFLRAAGVTGVALTAGQIAAAPGDVPAQPTPPAKVKAKAPKNARPAEAGPLKQLPLNVACIGVGGRGGSDLQEVYKTGARIVALCDTNANTLASAASKHAGAKTYSDFRKMLETQKDIEAVVVATPDHCHAPAAMMAIKMGKHVYVEKPMTHDLHEARALTEAARKYNVRTQMGQQGHASEGNRRQVEWVRQGVVGTVREVHVWTNRPIWPQGQTRPKGEDPVPDYLNWDVWLGPAPYRPYHNQTPDAAADASADKTRKSGRGAKTHKTYEPFVWRGWFDFGTGALGDMACHQMDTAHWALDLDNCVSVEAQSEGMTDESYPNWSVITYQFAEKPWRPAVKLVWYDGGKLPPRDLVPGDFKYPTLGEMFVGDKGVFVAEHGEGPKLLSLKGGGVKDFEPPPKLIPPSPGHHFEWVFACLGGAPAGSNFDYAGPLTETVLLGNLAVRLGKKVEWDSKALRSPNCPEADALIRKEYRKGWEL